VASSAPPKVRKQYGTASLQNCIALHYTVLYCALLYFTALYLIVRSCAVLW